MADYPGHPKFRRVRHSMNELITLKQYCSLNHIGRSAALNRIGRESVWGYKISGRWYVVDESSPTFDG